MDNIAMYKALIEVQKRALKAFKDGTNTFFGNSKYATLASILDAIRGPLTENGFALVQEATTGDMSVSVVTRLLHESGAELVSQPLSAPLKKEFTKTGVELPPSVQQIGSLVTYLRRYSLCPFLGVAMDDDDDGNLASHAGMEGGEKCESSKVRECVSAERTGEAVGNRQSAVGKGEAPHGATTNGQAGPGTRKSAHTGETLDTPEAVERHKAAAQAGGQKSEISGQTPEGEAPHGAAANANGGSAAKPQTVQQPDGAALNTRLYDAMERDKITEAEITGYLNGSSGKPRITRPVLAGSMTIHNLGERIADALVSGTDKDGKSNWETVVGRIRADRG